MLKSLYTAATGMAAQQANMDVVANNLANVSTVGFKKSRAEFEDLLYQNVKDPGQATGLNSITPVGVQTGLGVRTAAVQKDMALGNAIITKNPLDIPPVLYPQRISFLKLSFPNISSSTNLINPLTR